MNIERVAFALTVALAAMTFWLVPRLPMADLPQHAAQVALWRDLLLGTSKWDELLYINYFTPYLTGYTLTLLLSFALPISAAMKLLLTLAYVGFVAACIALRQRLGGDRRLDWLFIPGFFGYAYAWGFYTFLIATPIGMLFLVLAHRYADRPTPGLGVILLAADLALFFSHGLVFLFANGIGGAFLILRSRRPVLFVVAAAPYAAAGLLAVAYALIRLRFDVTASEQPFEIAWGWDASRLNFLVYAMGWPEGAVEADWNGAPLALLALAAPLLLGSRLNRSDATALIPLLSTLMIWAFVPVAALTTWLLYQRFSLFLLPSYALAFRPPDRDGRGMLRQLWLPVVCWAFLALHTDRLLAFARESAAFEVVLAAVPPGDRALSLMVDVSSDATGESFTYMHFPLWYQAEKAGFVDFNFAAFAPQVVRYRLDRAPVRSTASAWSWRRARAFDWDREHADIYRYFFVRHTEPLPHGYFPSGRCAPVLLKSAGVWSVYENVDCRSASAPGRPVP